MPTIADQICIFNGEDFSGRKAIVQKINKEFAAIKKGKGHPIINLFGMGGIGKTSIMQYIRFSNQGTPSAIIDFRTNSLDIFDIIGLLHDSLESSSENASTAFSKYNGVRANLDKVENKLFKRLKSKENKLLETLLSEPANEMASTLGDETTNALKGLSKTDEEKEKETGYEQQTISKKDTILSTVSGILSSVGATGIGKGIGVLATQGLGVTISKLMERQRQESITVLNQVGLTRNDIEVFINYKKNIIDAFIEGVNILADEESSLILGFDTFERVPSHISQWLKKDIIPNLNNRILVFICGRERITNDSSWSDLSGMINPICISFFTNDEAVDYLKKHNIKDRDRINWILKFTGCLPWALALTVDFIGVEDRLSTSSASNDFDVDIIGEKVVGRFLDEIPEGHLKNAVYLCSTANHFNFDIVSSYFKDIEKDEVVMLFKRVRDYSFTRNLDSENYAVHDVVSGFLLRGLKRYNFEKYKEICLFLCSYYKNIGGLSDSTAVKAKSAWEYIFHLSHIDETKALDKIDEFLTDSVPDIPLDIMEEYLYAGLKDMDFSSVEGKLYKEFGEAQSYFTNGNWQNAIESFEKIIPSARACSRILLAECSLSTMADIYLGQGHYAEVRGLLESLMADVQTLSFKRQKKVDARLNEVYGILGQYGKGERLALKSKKESEENKDNLGIAWALKSLGDIYRLWGKQEKSMQSFLQSIAIFRDEDNPYGEAVAKTQLARVYTHIGRWDDAEKLLSESELVYQQYGYKYGMANIILFRGNIHRLRHEWEKALQCYDRALKMHTEMQSWREISPIWGSMGIVYYQLGKKDKARDFFYKSIELKSKQGYTRGLMFSLMYVGDCFFAEKKWEIALASYIDALTKNRRGAKPLYVYYALDMKIFLCRFARNEYDCDNAYHEYENIEKRMRSYHYNHLLAFLEYEMIELNNCLSKDNSIIHAKRCLCAAKLYNGFLYDEYRKKLKKLFDKRFGKDFAEEMLY